MKTLMDFINTNKKAQTIHTIKRKDKFVCNE